MSELPSLYGVGQLEFKQLVTVLLGGGVRERSLELAEWLKQGENLGKDGATEGGDL